MNNKIILPAVGLVILAVVLFAAASGGFSSGPADSELKKQLNAHIMEYDRLAQMLLEDVKLDAIDPQSVFSMTGAESSIEEVGISQGRFAEYQLMLQRLEIKRAERQANGSIALILWSKGKHRKGVVYSDQPTLKWKPIRDRWYIFQK